MNSSMYERKPDVKCAHAICHSVLLSSPVGGGICFIAEKGKTKLKTEGQIGKDSRLYRIEFQHQRGSKNNQGAGQTLGVGLGLDWESQ